MNTTIDYEKLSGCLLALLFISGLIVGEFLVLYHPDARAYWPRMLPCIIMSPFIFTIAWVFFFFGVGAFLWALMCLGATILRERGLYAFGDYHEPMGLGFAAGFGLTAGGSIIYYWIVSIVVEGCPAFGYNPYNVYAITGINSMVGIIVMSFAGMLVGAIVAFGFWLLKMTVIVAQRTIGLHCTTLDVAAKSGNTRRVSRMIHGGVLHKPIDPNEPNEHGETPLQLAIVQGHPDVVRVLLKNGSTTLNDNIEIQIYESLKQTPNKRVAEAFALLEGKYASLVERALTDLSDAAKKLVHGKYNLDDYLPILLDLIENNHPYEIVAFPEKGHEIAAEACGDCNSAAWGGSNADYGCFCTEYKYIVDEPDRLEVRQLDDMQKAV